MIVERRGPVTNIGKGKLGMHEINSATQHRAPHTLRTKLDRVGARARALVGAEFNNLGHIIDIDLLKDGYRRQEGSKAVGTDGINKLEYGKELHKNLAELISKIRKKTYQPKPVRIGEIPKDDGSTRPLAISCFEDKLVQEAVKRIIEGIYEPIFKECSHGFRPKRGYETALVAVNKACMKSECGALLEIDLRRYFNTIPHKPLMELLRLKIKDENFLKLIYKLLRTPVQDKEGNVTESEIGSPQGSIVSPVLANIYLHYVLDNWFDFVNQNFFGGSSNMVRYADDCVFTFRNEKDAGRFKEALSKRLNKYGIELHKDKTQIMSCGSVKAKEAEKRHIKMPTFTFLGFQHVWGQSINGKTGKTFWRLKRVTCGIRQRKKLKSLNEYLKENRHKKELLKIFKQKVMGHVTYFLINDNSYRVKTFVDRAKGILFKWLNRRSQTKSYTWKEFLKILEKSKFPTTFKVKPIIF